MDKAAQTMIENLEKNSGRSLEEWINLVSDKGLIKHGEIVKYLKTAHGLTHGYANLISMKARSADAGSADSPEQLVTAQYKGKESLRSIYDNLISQIRGFGSDVEIAPKKAYVSLRRKKQFALIQPSTKTRLDIGINLKGTEPYSRLEVSGTFNTMCSHRVRVTEASEVNKELIGWLKQAYEAAG